VQLEIASIDPSPVTRRHCWEYCCDLRICIAACLTRHFWMSATVLLQWTRTVPSRSRTTVDCTTAVLRTWRTYQLLNNRSLASTKLLFRSSVAFQVSHIKILICRVLYV